MRRVALVVLMAAAAAIVALVLVQRESGPYAGLTRAEARALAVAAERTFELSPAVIERGRGRILAIVRSTLSSGDEAWLTIFGYGRHDNACVWVRRTPGGADPHAFEETQSTSEGRAPEPVHDRCVRLVQERGLYFGDVVGNAEVGPHIAWPQPASPFGRRPRLYAAFTDDSSAFTVAPLRAVVGTAPGTWAASGFVIDADTWRPIAGARVAIWPATFDGILRDPLHPPEGAISTISAADGSYAFIDVPTSRYGYVYAIVASGYPPRSEAVEDGKASGALGGDVHVPRVAAPFD